MASQMVIPFSDDTIFIRGFSARLSNDEIRNYFVKNGGSCSVEFFKQTENRDRLFIALKFDSKEVAKDVLNRYHREDVLGDRIQISWYKDLRRARAKGDISHYGRHYGGRYGNYGGYQGGRDRWRPQQRSRRYGHSSSRSPDRRYSTHSRSRTPSPRRHYRSDHSRSPSASSDGRSPSPVISPDKMEAGENLEGRDVSGSKSRESRGEKRRSRKISQTDKERRVEEDATETSKKESQSAKSERKSHKRSRREKVREEPREEEMDIEDAVQGKWKTIAKPAEHKAVRSRVVAVEPSDESRSPSPESPIVSQVPKGKNNGAVVSEEEGEYSAEETVYTKPVEKKKKRRRSPAAPPRRREYSEEFLADAEELELTAATKTDRHRKREVESPEEYRVVHSESRARKTVPPVEYEEDYPASPPSAVPPPVVEKIFPIGRDQPPYERESHFEVDSISSRGSRRSAPQSGVPPVHSPSPSPIPPPTNRRKRPITDEYGEVPRRRGEGDEVKVSRTGQEEGGYQRTASDRVAYPDKRMTNSINDQPSFASRELTNQRAAFNGGLREAEKGALGLSPDKLLLVRDKKEDIDKAYKQDCETFAAVTKMLISKDLSMEDRLQSALRDNLKDIGQRCIHELRDYIEQLRSMV